MKKLKKQYYIINEYYLQINLFYNSYTECFELCKIGLMDVEDNVINENMLVLRDVEHYQLSCLTIYRDDM
jgi:hypothetical protein